MYVGTRSLDWSVRGCGNYWSDNPAFDLDGDGIADTAYRPNDVIDQVIWRAPAAKLLLNSPAVQVVRWAQSAFPAIHPGGVIDSAPLMTPVPPARVGVARPAHMTVPIIALRGVSKSFGRIDAVRNLDLALYPGECVGLVGHNGAGKSTIIKLMLGLLRPTSGAVETLGEDPAAGAAARARRELGYLPESVALYPSMTGRETLAFYARLKGQPLRANGALLNRVGLGQAATRRVGTYSKGMRQRLALAQAILGQPRALLLDEPTTGLDPALRQSFYEILREMRHSGVAILLSSHALTELRGRWTALS